MKTWKLVSGILSMILCLIVMMLAGGIVSVASRKSQKKVKILRL